MTPVNLLDVVSAFEQINGNEDTVRDWLDKRDGQVYVFDREILGIV